jgi:hypothetical protein
MSPRPFEIIGYFVDELCVRRAQGARASGLARFLDENGIDIMDATKYFAAAFRTRFPFSFLLLTSQETGDLNEEGLDLIAEPLIDRARAQWASAPPYPDVASRRDREVFRAVAKRRRVNLLVQAVDPSSSTPTRVAYLLHGIYEKETGRNVWRPGEGEAIRDELNMRFGQELVRWGPQDQWEYRNDKESAGSTAGPQPPVICFEPDGNVWVYEDLDQLERFYKSNEVTWPFTNGGQTP